MARVAGPGAQAGIVGAMLCTLLEVEPVDMAIAAPFTASASAGSELPRGALVAAEGRCPGGEVAVELLSTPRWFQSALDLPPLGARGCVAEAALRPPSERLLVQYDEWPLQLGDVLTLDGWCDAWTILGQPLRREQLRALRPVTPIMIEDATRVQRAYEAHFGPLNLAEVPISGGGYVGLPLPRALSGDELAAEHARERLDTLDRQRRAIRWTGGEIDGRPTYAHFLGGDPAWSDIWGAADTIVAMLEMAAGWARACPSPAPERCLLQLGDLAWFDDELPDPLGHKDHHAGRCVDIRLFRSDGSRYEAWYNRPDDRPGFAPAYDQQLTIAFLDWVTTSLPVTTALFNDPVARRAVPLVRKVPEHDDHIHLCF